MDEGTGHGGIAGDAVQERGAVGAGVRDAGGGGIQEDQEFEGGDQCVGAGGGYEVAGVLMDFSGGCHFVRDTHLKINKRASVLALALFNAWRLMLNESQQEDKSCFLGEEG